MYVTGIYYVNNARN